MSNIPQTSIENGITSEPFTARVESSDVLPVGVEAAPTLTVTESQFTEAIHQPAPAALYEAPAPVVSPEVQAAHSAAEHHRHATGLSRRVVDVRSQYTLVA